MDRFQEVLDIISDDSIPLKRDAIKSPKGGDMFRIKIGDGIFKMRLGER